MNIYYYLKYYLSKRPLFMSLIRSKEAWLFDQEIKYVSKPTIDIGCGDGEFAKMVWGKIDTGIDLVNSRIQESVGNNVYKKTIIFDGIHMPVAANSFNTAVSNCVFEHVENLPRLLKEINRIVKPGGYLLTTVMAKPWEEHLIGSKMFGKVYKAWWRKLQDHHNLLTKSEWDKQFNSAGWKVIKVIGYLPPQLCQWIEIGHYLSVGYLISYKITGKWTWLDMGKILPVAKIGDLLTSNVTPNKSGAIFYVLRKQG